MNDHNQFNIFMYSSLGTNANKDLIIHTYMAVLLMISLSAFSKKNNQFPLR